MPAISNYIPECRQVETISIEVPFLGSILRIESNDFKKMSWDFEQLTQAALHIDKKQAIEWIDRHENEQQRLLELSKDYYKWFADWRSIKMTTPPDYEWQLGEMVAKKLYGLEFSANGRTFVFTKEHDNSQGITNFYFEPVRMYNFPTK